MNLFVGLLLALAAGSCMAAYPPGRGMMMQYVEEPPKPYQYSYEVDDGYYNRHHHNEESDAYGAKKGSYGYTDAQGLYRTVDYVADKNGYRAYVKSNEPGVGPEASADVVLHVKPVPDAVQAQAIMASYQPQMQALSMKPKYQPKMKINYQSMMDMLYSSMNPYKSKMDMTSAGMMAQLPSNYQSNMNMLVAQMIPQGSPLKLMAYQPEKEMDLTRMMSQVAPMKISYQPKMEALSAPKMLESAPRKITYQPRQDRQSGPIMKPLMEARANPMGSLYGSKMPNARRSY